jgi:hypothetical protein
MALDRIVDVHGGEDHERRLIVLRRAASRVI